MRLPTNFPTLTLPFFLSLLLLLLLLNLNITPTTASPSPNPNPNLVPNQNQNPDLDPDPKPLVPAGVFIPFVPVIVSQNSRRGQQQEQQKTTKPSEDTKVTVTKSNGERLHVYSGLTPQGYVYHGCYNETLDLPGTVGTRALYGGVVDIREGKGGGRNHHQQLQHQQLQGWWEKKKEKKNKKKNPGMTVRRCLEFCGGKKGYKFAGLEYAKECWCAQSLSTLSEKFPDSACDLGCEGNKTMACGGNNKLSVYVLSAAPSGRLRSAAALLAVGLAVLFNLS